MADDADLNRVIGTIEGNLDGMRIELRDLKIANTSLHSELSAIDVKVTEIAKSQAQAQGGRGAIVVGATLLLGAVGTIGGMAGWFLGR